MGITSSTKQRDVKNDRVTDTNWYGATESVLTRPVHREAALAEAHRAPTVADRAGLHGRSGRGAAAVAGGALLPDRNVDRDVAAPDGLVLDGPIGQDILAKFDDVGLHRLFVLLPPGCTSPFAQALQAHGFIREGILRDYHLDAQGWHDRQLLALTGIVQLVAGRRLIEWGHRIALENPLRGTHNATLSRERHTRRSPFGSRKCSVRTEI